MRSAVVGAVKSGELTLRALARLGHPPALVVTLPLEKAGRHSDFVDLRPEAARAGVPVLEAADVNAPEVLEALRRERLDHLFVVGWSQIVGPGLLAVPRAGAVGYHPAPLPELRGRAVIPWTILLGRETTGSTLFWLDAGVDSGDVIEQELFAVAPDETAASLVAKHLAALERMLPRVLGALAEGRRPRRVQDHARASYCAKRTAADGLIDWSRPAREVWTFVRAVGDPYPGAYTFWRGRKLTVWAADLVPEAPYFGIPGQVQAIDADAALVACGSGFVRLRSIEADGRGRTAPAGVLKNHERLGLDLGAIWRATGGTP